MATEVRVVDDRAFLLGLDEHYRRLMKMYESAQLLSCARRVAGALGVSPADVPIEGYYWETPELTEYFRLMKALRLVGEDRIPDVATLAEYQRLRAVTSAAIYGRSSECGRLFPVGHDPLAQALDDTAPDWTTARIVEAAYATMCETDDYSLVGLAALAKDAVVLAALAESVVFYRRIRGAIEPTYEYVWSVDRLLTERGERFVRTFNALFDAELPLPGPSGAESYWHAAERNMIGGRCVCLGQDDSGMRYYHWAIQETAERTLAVKEFWESEVWTSRRYYEESHGRPVVPSTDSAAHRRILRMRHDHHARLRLELRAKDRQPH